MAVNFCPILWDSYFNTVGVVNCWSLYTYFKNVIIVWTMKNNHLVVVI